MIQGSHVVCLLVFVIGLFSNTALVYADQSTDTKLYVLDRSGNYAQPRVVVPGICAWPNLTILPDGSIAAIVFNQPSHGRLPGEVDCWVTKDGGELWERRASPISHEPGTMTNRMNHAAGLTGAGDLLVICSGWTLIEKHVEVHDSRYDVDELLDTVVCRSSDGGATWAQIAVFPELPDGGGKLIPIGDVEVDSDGTLRVAAYARSSEGRGFFAYTLASRDDGKTWTDLTPINSSENHNESFMHHADDGRWLVLSRGKQMTLYEAGPRVQDWRKMGLVSEVNEVPGHLLTLSDGRLLLSLGRRVKGDEGVVVKLSSDGGATWSEPAKLVDFIGFDGGYPSSVQRSDGRVLTAYYAKKTGYHDGYHMGQVIWDPIATFGGLP